MAKNRDDINLTVTPILTLNNGIVAADINVKVSVSIPTRKPLIINSVIVFDGGEVAGAANISQGSKSRRELHGHNGKKYG